MEYTAACQKAYDFLNKEGFKGIYFAKETADLWVFYGGNPKARFYSVKIVCADKKTGELAWFDVKNRMAELKDAKALDIPEEYKASRD